MKVLGVIPARIGSTRFPEKPLALISGKPLLQWVIENSKKSNKIHKLIVATDDERIKKIAENCEVEAIMTDSNLPTGTDRIYAASKNLDYDIIVNIQGDEPLIQSQVLDTLIDSHIQNPNYNICTLSRKLKTLEELENKNCVKVLVNKNKEAIYFSRFPIPFSRAKLSLDSSYLHIGLYSYKKSYLETFCNMKVSSLEEGESLEQLRAIQNGDKILVTLVDYTTHGVDHPEDIHKIEKLIQRGNS